MDARSVIIDLDAIGDCLAESKIGKPSVDFIYNQFAQGSRVVEELRDDAQRQIAKAETATAQIEQERARLLEKESAVDAALAGLTTTLPKVLEHVKTSTASAISSLREELQPVHKSLESIAPDIQGVLRTFNTAMESGTDLKKSLAVVYDAIKSGIRDLDRLNGLYNGIYNTCHKLDSNFKDVQKALVAGKSSVDMIDGISEAINRVEIGYRKLYRLPSAFEDLQKVLVAGKSSVDKIDGISDAINRVEIGYRKLYRLPSAFEDLQKVLVAGKSSVDKIDGISDAINRVETGCRELHELPEAVCRIERDYDKLDGLARDIHQAQSEKFDGISNAINRVETGCRELPEAVRRIERDYGKLDGLARDIHQAQSEKFDCINSAINKFNNTLKSIETESVSTAGQLAKTAETHQKKTTESVGNIDRQLSLTLTETQFSTRIEPMKEIINATNKVVESLPSKAYYEEEISRHLASQAEYQHLKGNYDSLQRQLEELKDLDRRRHDDVVDIQNKLNRALNGLEEEQLRVGRRDHDIERLEKIATVLQDQLDDTQESLHGNEQVRADLEQSQQTGRALKERVDFLEVSLRHEEQQNAAHSKSLSEEAIKLEFERNRADRAENAERQFKASVDGFEALHRELQGSWEGQKQALEGQITDKTDTIKAKQDLIESMRSRLLDHHEEITEMRTEAYLIEAKLASAEEENLSLRKSFEDDKSHLQKTFEDEKTHLQKTFEDEKSHLQKTFEDEKSHLQKTFEDEKSHLQKTFEDEKTDLRKSLEYAQSEAATLTKDLGEKQGELTESKQLVHIQRVNFESAKGRISALENEIEATKAQNTVVMPEGPIGDLGAMYIKLANDLQDIPTVSEARESLQLRDLAVVLGPLLAHPKAKERLLELLESQCTNWYCLEQVTDYGYKLCHIQGRKCQKHGNDCVLVQVLVLERPALKFDMR
ncbi:hypothetical protein ACHAP8_010491 [Fusarium lateritium]